MGKQPEKIALPLRDPHASFVHNPNSISIGLVVFVGLTVESNRQTDAR